VSWRIAGTGLLAAVLIVLTVALRRYDDSGMAPDRFWASKSGWTACADVVVAGDSRVYRGVSPAAVSRVLPDQRILNFAFDGTGYDRAYLAAIERVLDPGSASPAVLLGISPHSLTPRAVVESGFRTRPKPTSEPWSVAAELAPYRDRVSRALSPIREAEIRTPWKHYYQEFHADGWVASGRRPEQPGIALGSYESRFVNNAVSSGQIEDVLAAVAGWSGRGVRVFAFRPPTCSGMVELENRLSGFDEAVFVRRFEAAGGVWLAVSQTDYYSYDGSHLRADAAVRLSSDLAERMLSDTPAVALSPDEE
jgi:hypothetical protein